MPLLWLWRFPWWGLPATPPDEVDQFHESEGPFYYDKVRKQVVEVLELIDDASRALDPEDLTIKKSRLYLVKNVATGETYQAQVFDLEGDRWDDSYYDRHRWFKPTPLNEMEVLAIAAGD